MNCITYARVSTQEQADRELSLPAQQQAMRDYASRQGWTVVGEFVERGVSARTADRPMLRDLLARCKQEPKVDVVLVHKIDRLARNVYDHATIRMFLKEREVKLASVVENVDDTVSGQLLENIMASLAQFYSGNLGEEIKKGMGTMIAQGDWPHRPPRGYVIVKDKAGRRITIDPAQAGPIRRAFELYATGNWSLRDIRQELERLGVKTRTGQPLPVENIRWLLQNRFYAGRVYWHEAEYPGNHEPIVTPELFARVQRTLKERHLDSGSKGKFHFWLRGVARCAECGARLTAERHGEFRYYRCIANTLNSRDCRASFINADRADGAVARLLRSLCLADGLKSQLRAVALEMVDERAKGLRSRSDSFRGRKTRLEEQEQRLTEAFAAGDISLSAYKGTVAKLRQQIEACAHALRVAPDPNHLLEKFDYMLAVAESLWELHSSLSPKQQTQFLRLIFKSLVLDRAGVSSYRLHEPFDALLSERPPGDKPAAPIGSPHLEDTQVESTIRDILEFDEEPLRQILESSVGYKSAA